MATDDGFIDLASVPLDTSYALYGGPGNPAQVSALMQQFSRKRLEAQVVVPTDDKRVQTKLRDMYEPICLFGEEPADRRDRLRNILVDIQLEKLDGGEVSTDVQMADGDAQNTDSGDDSDDSSKVEEFFTPGSDALLKARQEIARFSIERARKRVAFQRIESTIPASQQLKHRESIKSHLTSFGLFGSQLAGDRPACAVRFAPGDQLFAVGNVGGGIKLFDAPSMTERGVLRGHTGRIGGLSWFPQPEGTEIVIPEGGLSAVPADGDVDMGLASTTPQLASSDSNGKIHIWNLSQSTPVSSLTGHSARVCKIDTHPSGRFVGSASFDTSWRLWDVETTSELLLQEGHSREVYAISFHPDGSLVATGGLDSIGRVWDLRSGRSVMILSGHVGPIYALDWSVDGVRLLSGSADGFIKCWDIRNVSESAGIGGHVGGVVDIRWFRGVDGPAHSPAFYRSKLQPCKGSIDTGNGGADDDDTRRDRDDAPQSQERENNPAPTTDTLFPPHTPKTAGSFFVSAGFDKNVKIFSADDWALYRPLPGHSSNTVAVDVSADGRYVLSAGQDRTVKVWCRDDLAGIY